MAGERDDSKDRLAVDYRALAARARRTPVASPKATPLQTPKATKLPTAPPPVKKG